MRKSRAKIKEWLWRYGPAEVLSLLLTVIASELVYYRSGNRLGAAVAGTWAGNLAYFGTILAVDIRKARRSLQAAGQSYNMRSFLRNCRALLIEFGLAELLDTFFIRPWLMYQLPLWLGNYRAGVVAAKFAADVTFYLPSILFYEWSKDRFRKF